MKNKKLITLAATLLLFIGSVIGAQWFFNKIFVMKGEIVILMEEVATLKTQADRLVSLRQVASATGDELAELDNFFVAPDGALEFVEYVVVASLSLPKLRILLSIGIPTVDFSTQVFPSREQPDS